MAVRIWHNIQYALAGVWGDMMSDEIAIYDRRLLLYLDILGWSERLASGGPRVLLDVIERVHQDTEVHNEQFRQELIQRAGERVELEPGKFGTRGSPNPIFLGVQCGAFSDHFTLSMPSDFGGRILTAGLKLIVDLLHLGFLTRGAIVVGDLYHRDNVILGPALLEAHRIESSEAFYPRVIVSEQVLEELGELNEDRDPDGLVLDDGCGRHVVNPFYFGISVQDPAHAASVVASFESLNRHLTGVKAIVETNIRDLEAAGRFAHAEKWHYMKRFIEGPVLDADPRFRPYWK